MIRPRERRCRPPTAGPGTQERDGADIEPTPSENAPKSAAKARAAAVRARGRALQGALEQRRPRYAAVEIAFRWLRRDKEIAGGVLGGGLAYRFFFWGLALTYLLAGGLGFGAAAGEDVEAAAESIGLTAALAATIAEAAEQSESARWWLVLSGAVLVLWFSFGLLTGLRLVHAAAWRVPPSPLRDLPRAMAFVVAAPLALIAATALAGWARANSAGSVGVLSSLALGACFGAVWLWASMRLPSREARWTAFLPGAIVVGLGIEGLYVFTVYYLEKKLANASELYGALGLATTTLFYFFLVGRIVVWGAELNAVASDVRHERREDAAAAETHPADPDGDRLPG
jgi:uncharacterized BrkB/YihY/UPF0761 family membrane protein